MRKIANLAVINRNYTTASFNCVHQWRDLRKRIDTLRLERRYTLRSLGWYLSDESRAETAAIDNYYLILCILASPRLAEVDNRPGPNRVAGTQSPKIRPHSSRRAQNDMETFRYGRTSRCTIVILHTRRLFNVRTPPIPPSLLPTTKRSH